MGRGSVDGRNIVGHGRIGPFAGGGLRPLAPAHDPPGISRNQGIGRDGFHEDGTGRYDRPATNGAAGHDEAVRTHPDVILDYHRDPLIALLEPRRVGILVAMVDRPDLAVGAQTDEIPKRHPPATLNDGPSRDIAVGAYSDLLGIADPDAVADDRAFAQLRKKTRQDGDAQAIANAQRDREDQPQQELLGVGAERPECL